MGRIAKIKNCNILKSKTFSFGENNLLQKQENNKSFCFAIIFFFLV